MPKGWNAKKWWYHQNLRQFAKLPFSVLLAIFDVVATVIIRQEQVVIITAVTNKINKNRPILPYLQLLNFSKKQEWKWKFLQLAQNLWYLH